MTAPDALAALRAAESELLIAWHAEQDARSALAAAVARADAARVAQAKAMDACAERNDLTR